MNNQIIPIVEGIGEVESVPVLLRRLIAKAEAYHVDVAKPFRVKRQRVCKEGEIEKAVQFAVRDRERPGAVLVQLDADDDCPAKLGPELLERCKHVIGLPVAVVMANREMECWFLGAKESLRGVRGIRQDATTLETPEAVRDAKGRLSQNMEEGASYLEVDDQAAFAAQMDLDTAGEKCPSFAHLLRAFDLLIQAIEPPNRAPEEQAQGA